MKRGRALRLGLVALGLLGAAGAAAGPLPGWARDRAESARQSCFQAIEDADGRGDPEQCVTEVRRWTVWPALVRGEFWVREVRDGARADADRERLRAATARTPSRSGRAAAVAAMAGENGRRGRILDVFENGGGPELLRRGGAFDEAPFRAALYSLDPERIDEVAGARSDPQGALWLCFHGQAARGEEMLRSAPGLRQWQDERRILARIACHGGLPPDLSAEDQRDVERSALLQAAVASMGGEAPTVWELLRSAQAGSAIGLARLSLIASALAGGDVTVDDALLFLVEPGRGAPLLPEVHLSPWSLLRLAEDDQDPVVVDAATFEVAADRLEEMARTRGGPLSRGAALREEWTEPRRKAREDPATWLRSGAWALRAQAATEYARRFDDRAALAAAERADAIAPADRFESLATVSVYALAGEPERAFERLAVRRASEAEPADRRVRVLIAKALALASLDRWEGALDEATRASAAAKALDRSSPNLALDASILECALTFRAERRIPAGAEGACAALGLSGDARAAFRWKNPRAWLTVSVAPALLYILDEIGSDAPDPDVWSETARQFELNHPNGATSVRLVLGASVEAALWSRGGARKPAAAAARLRALTESTKAYRPALIAMLMGL